MNRNDHAISLLKLVLILGVAAIHSNVCTGLEPTQADSAGYYLVNFFSDRLTMVCVPCFFIISGYLFFSNVTGFRAEVYWHKLKRRASTLLVPYLIWNLVGLAVTLIKIYLLDFPSHGLVTDSHVNVWKLLEGFWVYNDGHPYAFAFWFIRNLMVCVILAPLAWLIAGVNRWVFAVSMVALMAGGISLYGFEYFAIGCGIARFGRERFLNIGGGAAAVGLALWVGLAVVLLLVDMSAQIFFALKLWCTLGAFAALTYLCRRVSAAKPTSQLLAWLVSSTFYVYAIHQFFCTVTVRCFIHLFGMTSTSGVVLAFVCTFLTEVIVSLAVWTVLKSLWPRLTRWLGGGR